MATDNSGFFSDPKNAISLFALLISITSLIWTLASQWEQNRRWDAVNLGRVELTDVGFIIWREISKEEALSTNWGYKPTLYSAVQNRVYKGQYQLTYELVLMDSDNKRIPNSNGFFTLPEAQQEIARLGLKETGKLQVFRHYQIQFDFKNTGSTTARENNIKITSHMPDTQEPVDVFTSLEPVDLLPASSVNAVANLFLPLNATLPPIMKFSVTLTYKDAHGVVNKRELPIAYDSNQNYWTYGR